MKKEKHENIDEVSEEIDAALNDPKGILSHQKRLGFCLSEGIKNILEEYLKKENVFKSGFKIDHRILKKKKENVKQILSEKITAPIENLKKLDKILDVAFEIESKRNELVYGNPSSEDLLKKLINMFLDIQKEVRE